MKELKVFKGPGCQSNAAKVEALMRHLAYSEEKIAEVLKTMKKKKKAKDQEGDDLDDLIGKHCEAEMLSRLLHEKPAEEEDEGQGKGKKRKYAEGEGKEKKKDDEKNNKDGEKPVAWPKHVDKSAVDIAKMEFPPGCSLQHVTPASASPGWKGVLPEGEVWMNHHTKTKSYKHSEGVGRASLSSESAKAAVVSWLWEWYEDSTNKEGTASSSSSKKPKTS